MKRYLIIIAILLSIPGCAGEPEDKTILARINNYEITQERFKKEFMESPLSRTDTAEARKAFLDNLIDRKLILQYAQSQGLDRHEDFLRLIEKFWEQSLLKITLDKKSKEIANSVRVSDREIEEMYKKMLAEGKTDKLYEEIYAEIKWKIIKSKESQMINTWLEELRKKADIKTNLDLLEENK